MDISLVNEDVLTSCSGKAMTLLPKYVCVESDDYYNTSLTLYFCLYNFNHSWIYILEYRIASNGHIQFLVT